MNNELQDNLNADATSERQLANAEDGSETAKNVSRPIELIQGRPMTTSLVIAKHFGMEHREVLRAIRTTLEDLSEDFGRCNFAPSSYINLQNKSQPMYRLTRNGFAFIAMGFTGRIAARWKEVYIKAFDTMEQKITDDQLAKLKSNTLQFKRRNRGDGMDAERFADFLVAMDGRVNAAKIVTCLVEHKALTHCLGATLQEIVDLLGGSLTTSAVAYNCRKLRSERLLYFKPGRSQSQFHLYPDMFEAKLRDKGLHELLIALQQETSKALH
jgi:Rha family phage regulatory protein